VESHLQSATRLHLELAWVKFESTEVRLTSTEAKLYETQVKLYNTEQTTRKLLEKLDILQRQFEKKLGQLGAGQLNAPEEKIFMVKKERANCPSEFVWKVADFSKILRKARTEEKKMTESVPFYTKRHGYKLKVRVYPRGITSGKNTHLSVYIIVMKGEYDAILPWPFEKRITFTIIDQQEDLTERQNAVMRLIPGNHPECFARPINEDNKTRGFAQFISHEKLHSRRYLLHDTLFLQVEVGP